MAANDILRVPGNYTIQAKTGVVMVNSPETFVTGNLRIDGNIVHIGTMTSVTVQDTTIRDNIIILNSGETNLNPSGQVTLGTAGIQIARGDNNNINYMASLLYDDASIWTIDWSGTTSTGIWKFGKDTDILSQNTVGIALQTTGIFIPKVIYTLTVFGSYNPLGVISVRGTTDYENQVTHDDHIPNKKYVDNLSASTEFAKKLVVGFSSVELKDNTVSTSSVAYYSAVPTLKVMLGTSTNTATVFQLQGTEAQFTGLNLNNNTISSRNANTDILITPNGTGIVQTGGALRIGKTTAIASTASFTGIYSTSTVGGGGTGLYFVNTVNTDELVSRRRSIIYGIIF
jgi:hypothetical protein